MPTRAGQLQPLPQRLSRWRPARDNGLVAALVHPIDTWRTSSRLILDPLPTSPSSRILSLGIQFLARRAQENLDRLRQDKALVGQLLPYVPHRDAAALGLTVDREHGLLDPLRASREGITVRHPNRYT